MSHITLVANWKMKLTDKESIQYVREFKDLLQKQPITAEIILCPSFVSLKSMYHDREDAAYKLSAQNMFWEEKGAYTGEVGVHMIKEFADYVVLGHSERRQYMSEDDSLVGKKATLALAHGLTPIICIGEGKEVYRRGGSHAYIEQQLQTILKQLDLSASQDFIIAYEPLWAISTAQDAKQATPKYADEICSSIRQILKVRYNEKRAINMRILYGGSVDKSNVRDFTKMKNINGALVGSASTSAEGFYNIIVQVQK